MGRSDPVVDCTIGTVTGSAVRLMDTNMEQFLGIPYAKIPVGEKRFAHPEPTGFMEYVWAQNYGSSCVQPQVFPSTDDARPIPQSEDCLFLNIYRRAGTEKSDSKAVMVIIHGGGFSVGGSSDLSFNGLPLACYGDVIAVSINYRLGILGFAHVGDVIPGNLGLFDQRLALEWVKLNIKYFGGDPNCVTLIGTSAGAMSICAHVLSPVNRYDSLFHAAIIDGGVLTEEMLELPETSCARVKAVARKMGCPVDIDDEGLLKFLREADARELVENSFDPDNRSPMLTFIPTKDDIFIPRNFARNIRENADNFIKVRTMIGYAKDEGTLFANYYLDGRPFPNISCERDFLSWCNKLARAYNLPMDLIHDAELRRKVVNAYYRKEASAFAAAAAFFGEATFKGPTNAFIRNYSRFNKHVYVYQFERKLNRTYFKLDPEILGVYHFSPYLHFTGAVIDTHGTAAPEDTEKFVEYIQMVSKFAKSQDTPTFKNVRWPNYSRGEGIMVLNDVPTTREALPSLADGQLAFDFED